MRAAFPLREERVHENKAMLDATFGDPLVFLPKIGAQGAGGGGSAKSLALASAVKKGRKRESRDFLPYRRMYIDRRARLSACAVRIPGKPCPRWVWRRRTVASSLVPEENLGTRCYVRAETEPCCGFVQALCGRPGPTGGDGKGEKSSLPLLPKPLTEALAVPEGVAAAKRAAQIEKEKQLQVN